VTGGEYVALVAAGLVSGALNYVAAGGAVFSFLVLGWLGFPATIANATNLAATPASFLTALPGAWRDRHEHAQQGPLLAVAILGTLLGAWLFTVLPGARFRQIAPVLLLMAAVALIVHPVLKHRLDRRRATGTATNTRLGMTVGIATTSLYAGFYGGGVGVFVIVVLALTTHWPWLAINGLKNVICLVTSLAGLGAYALTGLVDWPVAAVLGASMALGGFLGQKVIDKLPRQDAEEIMRQFVSVAAGLGAGVMIAS
jgi:uncharacterized membrane protein YfcA